MLLNNMEKGEEIKLKDWKGKSEIYYFLHELLEEYIK